jgi:hypothetical protein
VPAISRPPSFGRLAGQSEARRQVRHFYAFRVFRPSGLLAASVTILVTADQLPNVWFAIVILPNKFVLRMDLRRFTSRISSSAFTINMIDANRTYGEFRRLFDDHSTQADLSREL